MLYVRNLDSMEVKLLPGSENALEPFWSPDSRSIAFGSNGKLKSSDLTGGSKRSGVVRFRSLSRRDVEQRRHIIVGSDYDKTLLQVSA